MSLGHFTQSGIDARRFSAHTSHMAKNTENIVGPIISRRLDELGKTQLWLATEMRVSPPTVSRWVNYGDISRKNLGEVAQKLSMSIDQLMGVSTQSELPLQPQERTVLQRLTGEEQELLENFRVATDDGKKLIKTVAKGAEKKDRNDVLLGRAA